MAQKLEDSCSSHKGQIEIKLDCPFIQPWFFIGARVQATSDTNSLQGEIVGVKLAEQGWSYLIRCQCLECWCAEENIIPVIEGQGGIKYKDRWFITAQSWSDAFVYKIYDRQTELESTGLSLHNTYADAIAAARKFLEREFRFVAG